MERPGSALGPRSSSRLASERGHGRRRYRNSQILSGPSKGDGWCGLFAEEDAPICRVYRNGAFEAQGYNLSFVRAPCVWGSWLRKVSGRPQRPTGSPTVPSTLVFGGN